MPLPERKKNDGSGRAAAAIAKRFAVNQAMVYQARRVLISGSSELIAALRRGEIPVKTAYKRLRQERNRKERDMKIEQAR